jgi:hypothetical protein
MLIIEFCRFNAIAFYLGVAGMLPVSHVYAQYSQLTLKDMLAEEGC